MMIAGILSPIENALAWLLEHLHDTVGLSWGWSIVALTIIVRIALVPIMVKQIHSMQRMQAHMPEMKAIQTKYKGDRQRLNEELMKFYKENEINPAASCLPMLVQIPVFFALYFVLRNFTKHVQALPSELHWLIVPNITAHVTVHWSGYVLLVLYLGSQVGYAYFGTPPNIPKSQRILFMIVPFFILPFVSRFPIGLLLYWMTTNLWTVGQGIITRRMVPKPAPAPKRSSRTPPKDEVAGNGDGGGDRRCRSCRAAARDPRPAAPCEAQEETGRPVSEQLTVEATGETVGEAKWQALRDLERMAPGLDKAAVRFEVVSEGERGLLGVGYTPARVIAAVDAPAVSEAAPAAAAAPAGDESELAADLRELLEPDHRSSRRRLQGRGRGGRRGRDGLAVRRRPRPADRPPRPDDRRDPVPGERDRVPRVRRRPQGRGRGRRRVPRAPP